MDEVINAAEQAGIRESVREFTVLTSVRMTF